MLERFEIRQGERAVGWARVVKQGLYYHFSCRCRLTGEVMHRISVRCGDREEDLGVCVPMDGQFGLEKRVPCKRFPDGKMEFFLSPHHEKMEGKFIAVYPEKPFMYMARLKDAFLRTQAGQAGIVIRE